MIAADQELFDEILTDALDILRLSASERQLMLARIAKLERELVATLNEQNLSATSRRTLNAVLKKCDEIIYEHYGEFAAAVDAQAIAELTGLRTTAAIETVLGLEAAKMLPASYLNSIASNVMFQGSVLGDWWRGQAVDIAFKFAGAVRQGLLSGETNQQIIARIVGTDGVPGVMDIARRNAATLVQTSVQAVAADARRRTFQANSDVIAGIQQVSTLDSHTSITCIAYSGATWDLDFQPIRGNDLPYNGGVPRHFNCRSVEVPITKTFKELGLNIAEPKMTTRASVDGQVPVNTSFDDFLKRKGEAWQNEVLGSERAQLWREGKITLRDLVNGEGRPLTLDELRAKFKQPAFSAANYMKRFDDPNVTQKAILAKFPGVENKIEAVQKKVDSLTSTHMLHGANAKGEGYSAERLKLHNQILYEGVEGFDPETGGTKFYPGLLSRERVEAARPLPGQAPTYTVLGGRGGSGKSGFANLVYDPAKVVKFDADEVKHMIPEFKGYNANQVHEESGHLIDRALNEARNYNVNTVLDATMKTYDTAKEKVDAFKAAGYRIEAHYMFAPRQLAAERAVDRFIKGGEHGRYVPPDVVLGNVNNEANFDKIKEIADDWSFRDAQQFPSKLVAKKP